MSKTGPKTEAGLAAISASAKELDHTAWTSNPDAVEAIQVAKRLRNTKHGLYASVPIICKAEACPYSHSCPLVEMEKAPYGEKCPIEIAAIEDLFERYAEHFEIDLENRKASDTIDLMIVKDLVDADIGLLRCDNKMAWDADYIVNNTVGMSEDGEPITRQELHPLTDYKEKLINRKNKSYQLLNSTRKDKEGQKLTIKQDPSVQAAEMVKVNQDMEKNKQSEHEAKKAYYKKMNMKMPEEDDIIDVEPIDYNEEE
ncbi:hypothetical protein [Virgibacillus salexigens]|uniref:Uncharacterized protein n=1 Tax=Virgibacillus massiliensis TaxID=1462526 RepID=A0A024QIQ0_9BACI|nr:hypothetical protein [Virgibacillus massiliensis]CDQ41836.1 hypothetical protein BN990_04213 [Virgibacillus massiliensis]